MRTFLQLIVAPIFLTLLILGAVFLNSTGQFLRSVQTDAAKKTVLSEELQREEQLIQGMEVFQGYKRAKLQVAEEVIAGRLSVAEALEAFRRLEGQRLPNSTKQITLEGLKMSEDEWLGKGVLDYVEQVLVERPDEAAAVITRLKKALEELLADRKKRSAAPVEKPIEQSR